MESVPWDGAQTKGAGQVVSGVAFLLTPVTSYIPPQVDVFDIIHHPSLQLICNCLDGGIVTNNNIIIYHQH